MVCRLPAWTSSGSWKYAVAYDPHSKTAIMILRQENFRNRLVKLQNGEMHYVFSGLPANQDLNEMSQLR